jgi:hypothetical protein
MAIRTACDSFLAAVALRQPDDDVAVALASAAHGLARAEPSRLTKIKYI